MKTEKDNGRTFWIFEPIQDPQEEWRVGIAGRMVYCDEPKLQDNLNPLSRMMHHVLHDVGENTQGNSFCSLRKEFSHCAKRY